MKINEAYELFIKEQSDKVIRKSKFLELRPPEVLLSSQMPRNVCGCIYHTKIKLLLQEMHKKYPEHFPLYGDEFIKACVCDKTSKSCTSSDCHLCKDKFWMNFSDKLHNQGIQNESEKWCQWEKVKMGILILLVQQQLCHTQCMSYRSC